MSLGSALSAVGLVEPTRRRGFCPSCRIWAGAPTSEQYVEIAPPAVTALVVLAVAAVAWGLVVRQSGSTGGMAMGSQTLGSFATSWLVMMTAMMLPSALPLVFEFSRNAVGRRGWLLATGVLGVAYLSIWLAFGIGCYLVRALVPASWFDHRQVGAVALALAGLYGLTPIKRASEARCRELCALHEPLPFNLRRSAFVVGARYGLSCVGCSVALMVAMVIIGMANLGWIVVLSGVVLLYKLAPAPTTRRTLMLSTALGALGVIYGLMA
jgi:predicted metal-binding membrane protein